MKNSEDNLATKYPDVFDKGLGRLPGKVYLHVDPASQPVFLPARKMEDACLRKGEIQGGTTKVAGSQGYRTCCEPTD